jgi:hypothetical protein
MSMLAPWHLWGGSAVIDCPYTGIFSTTVATSQLNRISYGRPETWNFFFLCRVLETTLAVPLPTVGQVLDVYFDLSIGVGRSQATIQGFEHYSFVAAINARLDGDVKYSTAVIGPVRIPGATPPINDIQKFVAQNIQLNVRGIYSTAETHGDNARIAVETFFAPASHIRPEWYRGDFPGGEDHGS